jgi:malonyl-CoA O-methyltransferase
MRRRFNRVSATFEQASFLHREIRERLVSRLALLHAARRTDFEPKVILDLGAARSELARALQKLFPKALVIALDFAESMLPSAHSSLSDKLISRLKGPAIVPLCADARQLPLASASIDLVVSNAMLHCCLDPELVFTEVRRVLRPGGAFSFTTFGPDTLRELRAAWSHIDQEAHVQPFIEMHNLGDRLVRTGLADPVLDLESIQLTYASFDTLLAELKAIGGTYWPIPSEQQRQRTKMINMGLAGRGRLRALESAYQSLRQADRLPVTAEVIYGLTWQPPDKPLRQRPGQRPGETLIPVESLRRAR